MVNLTTSAKGEIKPLLYKLFKLFHRLEKLKEFFTTTDVYSTLSLSHIEGIEQLNSRFNLSVANLKKKPYDVLDQRKTDFDSDYEDFKRQIQDLDVRTTM